MDIRASPRRSLKAGWRWAKQHWATRSLAVGAVSTVLDVCTLILCVYKFHVPNAFSAVPGVVVGAVFSFFANRHFAFKDHDPKLAPQALKFAAGTTGAIAIHTGLMWLFAQHFQIPAVLAKFIADIMVFSVGQLLLLRYIVFPKSKGQKARPTARAGRSRLRLSEPREESQTYGIRSGHSQADR